MERGKSEIKKKRTFKNCVTISLLEEQKKERMRQSKDFEVIMTKNVQNH